VFVCGVLRMSEAPVDSGFVCARGREELVRALRASRG
jgi:hypothetical protein